MTNSGYTAAAEELASHLGVLLLADESFIEKIEPPFEIDLMRLVTIN